MYILFLDIQPVQCIPLTTSLEHRHAQSGYSRLNHTAPASARLVKVREDCRTQTPQARTSQGHATSRRQLDRILDSWLSVRGKTSDIGQAPAPASQPQSRQQRGAQSSP